MRSMFVRKFHRNEVESWSTSSNTFNQAGWIFCATFPTHVSRHIFAQFDHNLWWNADGSNRNSFVVFAEHLSTKLGIRIVIFCHFSSCPIEKSCNQWQYTTFGNRLGRVLLILFRIHYLWTWWAINHRIWRFRIFDRAIRLVSIPDWDSTTSANSYD